MPYIIPPIVLTQGQTSVITIPGDLGNVAYLKMVNASPYLLSVTNLLGGSDYMQPGEANIWELPGLTTSPQVTPQLFGISPAIIPSTVLVVTWYLTGERPQGSYPVNFNTLSFLGSSVTTNVSTPNSLNQDEYTPFVVGPGSFVATKDGSTANKLDLSGGVAWLRQTDQSLGRVAGNATSFLTVQINSTYFLDLNPDGTYSFGTSHSVQPNYLAIAQVTTDASANILTVTDERTLNTTLWAAMLGAGGGEILAPPLSIRQSGIGAGFPSLLDFTPIGASVTNEWAMLYSGSDGRLLFQDITSGKTSLQLAPGGIAGFSQGIGEITGQATAGVFGVPAVVAVADNVHVTTTAATNICTVTPSAPGLYRCSMWAYLGGANPSTITAFVHYNSSGSGTGHFQNFNANNPANATYVQLNAVSLATPADLNPFTILVRATTGTPVAITYQNATATPNDFVSAMIERLA